MKTERLVGLGSQRLKRSQVKTSQHGCGSSKSTQLCFLSIIYILIKQGVANKTDKAYFSIAFISYYRNLSFPSHPPRFDHSNSIWRLVQIIKLLIMHLFLF
jgi:hypothetical protein